MIPSQRVKEYFESRNKIQGNISSREENGCKSDAVYIYNTEESFNKARLEAKLDSHLETVLEPAQLTYLLSPGLNLVQNFS